MTDNPFAASGMASGYARSRPPVHPQVIELAATRLGSRRFHRALDVGCGAGLSTAPLGALADLIYGIEPAEPMLKWSASIAPGAVFLAGAAEALPFAAGSLALLTAAGSLNYVALDRFFAEAARVLDPTGMLLVYDFAPGRESADAAGLPSWFAAFFSRYPAPRGEGIPITARELARPGFRTTHHEDFAIPLVLTPDFYLEYMLTETNVAKAVREGTPLDEIRSWCSATLAPVFDGKPRTVLFRGYFAWLERTGA
jgi:SAM-dependent methyltransferase